MQEQLNPQESEEVKGGIESVQSPALDNANDGQNPEMESSEESQEERIDYSGYTDGELVEAAKELMKSNPESYASIKDRMESIKRVFYKNIKTKVEELLKKFIEDGGKRENFAAPANPLEEELRELMNKFKEKRAAELLRSENEKKENLEQKNRILDDMKALLESEEDFSAKMPKFKKLQQEWKEVGNVPAAESNSLWKTYQLYNENFYDNLKINNELRDYDFRKNLEQKIALCEQAEKLADVKDVVTAARKLQSLHDEWRIIGPVSRENREEIWTRFKDASTVINKRHHDYFEQLRSSEMENLEKKKVLCERMESIDLTAITTYKEWQEKTDEVLAIQAEWKTIGFAPKKDNTSIFERFRAACDSFFKAKNLYFKNTKEQNVSNLNKKIALCEKAEALMNSEDWKKTTDTLVQLQKEWKTIGAVPKKQSEAVWKRFVTACDTFFNRKNEQLSGERAEQDANLEKKKAVLEKIKSLELSGDSDKDYSSLKELISEWSAIGYVPFKEKDKLHKAYKSAIDEKFAKIDVDHAARKVDAFKLSLQDMPEKEQQKMVSDERRRLVRKYDAVNSEIATYENNMGFFSNSKNASSMLREVENKVERLKKDRDMLLEQIKKLDEASK